MAVELCGRAGDHHGLLLNRLHRATLLLEQGDIAASAFEVEAFQRLALEVNQPQALWIAQALRACRLLLEGRLAEVEAIAAECLQTGHRVQDHNALQTFGVHITLVRIEQGRAAEMLDALRTFAASYPRTVAWRAIYTFALHSAGERAACAAEFQSSKVNRFALPEDLVWQISMAWFSEVCHALGDAEAAATLYERFAASSGRSVVIGYGIACLGSVDRYLALLCATLDRRDAAERHFQQALEMNRRLGGTLPLAHTLFDYALFLLGREPGRRDFALEQLREAESLARERDLPVLRRRIEQVAL
jgi:tetratricopeptide (TPR) repeat protein